ncbi:MAG: hypothetical protein ABIP80_02605 [Ferruginibacter sp.]
MPNTYIIIAGAGVIGFLLAWIIRSISYIRLKKVNKSLEGYLESEKLIKDTLLKENKGMHLMRETNDQLVAQEIARLKLINKRLDEDILLLQKSNEETEALLEVGQPVIHSLKLQLIEANNYIARHKLQTERKGEEKASSR